jgi:Flp pilus assembly protein TadG
MTDRPRSQRGIAAIELAIVLPLLVFLAMTAVPVIAMELNYAELNQVSQAGARYATAAHLDPETPGVYRFRPDTAAVEAYVRRISDLPLDSVTVAPDPASSFPGDQITVTVTYRASLGPLATVANALAGLVRARPPFPEGGTVLTSTAVMREE